MRHTKGHSANRRSHHALKNTNFTKCKNCNSLKKSHIVCKNCGFYAGRKVVDLVKKIEKKQKKEKASQK